MPKAETNNWSQYLICDNRVRLLFYISINKFAFIPFHLFQLRELKENDVFQLVF